MQTREETGKQPPEKVRQRLLQACEEEPGFPDVLLEFLPNTPDAHVRFKRILDEEPNPGPNPLDPLGSYFQRASRRSLREWLIDIIGYRIFAIDLQALTDAFCQFPIMSNV